MPLKYDTSQNALKHAAFPILKRMIMWGGLLIIGALCLFHVMMPLVMQRHFQEIPNNTLKIIGSMASDTLTQALNLDIPLGDMRGVSEYFHTLLSLHPSLVSISLTDPKGLIVSSASQTTSHRFAPIQHTMRINHRDTFIGTLTLHGQSITPSAFDIPGTLFAITLGAGLAFWLCFCVLFYIRHMRTILYHIQQRLHDLEQGVFQTSQPPHTFLSGPYCFLSSLNSFIIHTQQYYRTIKNRLDILRSKQKPIEQIDDMMRTIDTTFVCCNRSNDRSQGTKS